ncbi:transcription factor GTE12 isoform X5 [Manihot esculenta]|uniref:transcription factor GTE12 isoform X5 n=1 Tax=Manihot esculenta TaxID=3983 RepID=UPI001CC697DA|nr:transcription factor GTE12 isoform X5 [Manihot esculenta]
MFIRMITAETMVAKKLKIKFPTQRMEAVPGIRVDSGCNVDKNYHSRACDMPKTKLEPAEPRANKRRPLQMLEGRSQKKRKMDHSVSRQCFAILKSLINNPSGWVFKEPVDPVALNIPDYFSIISHPMDLGTIKSKLEKNQYFGTEEFAADVRLTFSNAMLYNPPTNYVHKMAESLNKIFETKWKSLVEKWNCEVSESSGGKNLSRKPKEISTARQNSSQIPLLPKGSKLSEDKATRSSANAKAATVKHSKPVENCMRKASQLNSFEDISSERSLSRDDTACGSDASKLQKSMSTAQRSKSDLDSDGAVSALDDENACPSSQLMPCATDVTSGEGGIPHSFDVQLSPTKALRAAMLKYRFADTILKAQQKTLLDHCEKADLVKMQREKERLERKQREEKALIEAQIRAAEANSRRSAELELKKQREKEREAARVALQKMEKTVYFEQDLEILKELEMLSGGSLSYHFRIDSKCSQVSNGEMEGSYLRSPLERLGLFMKNDIWDEDDKLQNGDEEEGEIFP